MREEAPKGEPDRAWREAVLQTHLFAGIPRVVEAFNVLQRAGGLGDLDDDEATVTPDVQSGRELFASIYGTGAASVRTRLEEFHPALATWIAQHAYGTVLVRPGLDAKRRELLAVACLGSSGPERQLVSHTRGALAMGVSPKVLGALPTVLAEFWSETERDRFRRVLDRELSG